METLLYWLEHCDDKGYLSLTALCLLILLLNIWIIKSFLGGNE